jgi:hypothetical protein
VSSPHICRKAVINVRNVISSGFGCWSPGPVLFVLEKRLWAESLAGLNWAEQASSFPGLGWTCPGEAGALCASGSEYTDWADFKYE